MKKIVLIAISIGILLWGTAASPMETGWEDLNRKARKLKTEAKYTESLKAYEDLILLTQKKYGEKHVKVADVLIEMAILYRYDLRDEKKYDEFQDRAKNIKLTLNGTVRCPEPQGWTYEPCRERWLGPDPCFIFRNHLDYIKVTYYGLDGSEFRKPEDFTGHLKGLFGKFEAMETVKVDGRETTRVKLRYKQGNRYDRDGRYRMTEFLYEEFLMLPLKKGFLTFNFKLDHHVPIPLDLAGKNAPQDPDGAVFDEYRSWISFTESCKITD